MSAPISPNATPATTKSFSLAAALSDAANYTFGGFPALLRLSWKFAAFVVIVSALLFVCIGLFAGQRNSEVVIYVFVGIGILLAFLVSVAYYIVVMRNWLLGEDNPRVLAVYGGFLFRVVALTVILLAVMAVIFLPPLLGGIAAIDFMLGNSEPPVWVVVLAIIGLIVLSIFAVLFALYIAGRLSPWMVAAAVGGNQTLSETWHVTKGAGLRIMAGMIGLTMLFMLLDFSIEAAISPLLGLNSEAFEKIGTAGVSLPALYGLLLVKILVFFPQTAASMVYCASVYRQTSGRG